MSQSVKLSDGSYIDSTGIYDTATAQAQNSLNAKTARIGGWLQTPLSTENSWTPTTAGESKVVASLALTEGIWLVQGHFMDWIGYKRLWIDNATGFKLVGSHEGASPGGWTLDTWAITEGNRTVNLVLRAQAIKTFTWSQDANYWRMTAIRIG